MGDCPRGRGRPPLEGGSRLLAVKIPAAMDTTLRAMGKDRPGFVRNAIAAALKSIADDSAG